MLTHINEKHLPCTQKLAKTQPEKRRHIQVVDDDKDKIRAVEDEVAGFEDMSTSLSLASTLSLLDLLAHIKLMQTTFAPHDRLLVHSLFKTQTELYIKVYALCHSFNHFTHGWLHVQDNYDDYALL